MGVGFCMIAQETYVDQIIAIVQSHNKKARRIGYVVSDQEKHVHIKPYHLIGRGKRFWEAQQPKDL
jgi:phosphoribosylaminoimidazole (AIR) synthetase